MQAIAGKATLPAPEKSSGTTGRALNLPLPKPQPQVDELIFSDQVGDFQVIRTIRLALQSKGALAVVTWREGNLETSGRNLGEALDAFSALLAREATRGNQAVLAFLHR